MSEELWEGNVLDYKCQTTTMNRGKGKSMYTFSAERMQISAFRSPACWLYPLKPGGERKSAYVQWKTYTLIYPDPMNRQQYGRYNCNKFVRNVVIAIPQTGDYHLPLKLFYFLPCRPMFLKR